MSCINSLPYAVLVMMGSVASAESSLKVFCKPGDLNSVFNASSVFSALTNRDVLLMVWKSFSPGSVISPR